MASRELLIVGAWFTFYLFALMSCFAVLTGAVIQNVIDYYFKAQLKLIEEIADRGVRPPESVRSFPGGRFSGTH